MATKDFEAKIRELVEEFVVKLMSVLREYNDVPRIREVANVERLAELFSALSTPGRLRLLFALERSPRRFRELEVLSGLRGGSLKNALDKFLSLGLIDQSLGLYRITPKGRFIVNLIKEVSGYV